MAISSIGVGSGLKLDELLENLRTTEKKSLAVIQNRQIANTNKISAYGQLKSSLGELQSATKALSEDSFGAVKVTANSENIQITGKANAAPGQYVIKVDNLATRQTLTAAAHGSRDSAIGEGGKITVRLANGKEHTLDMKGKDTSLQGVMNAINADAELGMKATIINTGNPSEPYRLQLSAEATGEAASISTINVEGNDDLAAVLNVDASDPAASGFEQTKATNAKLTVNGIAITSQSNTLKNTIEGLEITLNKAGEDPINVEVAKDDSAALNAVKDYVAAYNKFNNAIRSLTAYNVDLKKGAALTGDSMAREAQNAMRDATLGFVPGEGQIRSMVGLGITVDPKTGDLQLDEKKLTEVLKTNMADVKNMFLGEQGIAGRVHAAADEFIKKGGRIDNVQEGAEKVGKRLQDQFDAADQRIENKIEAYRKQFVQLDVMINRMQGTSNYLSQQLSMLGNMNSNK
ncbi:flagellar filament capping protein FliD [Alcaligenes aquatilis]|uniref:Flagellar hook-associated protein 2 n=1 Tax=Alcaligenes aquatilis TaxID=323284 RepID=A0ABY4NJB2_9BURK|nr:MULTISPECIES: flagellar filament capping protein FliD [Alcaligenes]MCC9163259.1 flagellar filament capping protein FliD [Alcaligenes sp. MMA]UQN37150.1 flagellar filament capping protein FliD [Alcaligenes aquatilis]